MIEREKDGFWFTTTEPDGTKKREWVSDNGTTAKIGRLISDILNAFFRSK